MKRRDKGEFIDPMKRDLSGNALENQKVHYLVHVTSVGAGREIVHDGKLEVNYCRHFEKDLVYFFIDRAGYRPSGIDEKSDQINRFPFIIVHKLMQSPPIFHAYPFDTGAALDGLFKEKEDPFVYVEDYELRGTPSGISAHISWAFDNTLDYFKGQINASSKELLEPWHSVERSYFDIAQLASPTHNRPDNRASAVEIAFDNSFNIHKTNTLAIFPKQLIESGKNSNLRLMDTLSDRKISWLTYNWLPNSRPFDFFQEITQMLENKLSVENNK